VTKLQETNGLDEERGAWSGEPISFSWDGDRFRYQMLLWNVALPSRHLHPLVREAAERVKAAQTEREQLAQELASRGPEREQLAHRLAQESARTPGPGAGESCTAVDRVRRRDQSDRELDSRRRPVCRRRPGGFSATVTAVETEWNEYLRLRGREAVVALQGAAQTLQSPKSSRCRRG
jgi:hypothetical protein